MCSVSVILITVKNNGEYCQVFYVIHTIYYTQIQQAGLSWGSVQAETISLEPCLARS